MSDVARLRRHLCLCLGLPLAMASCTKKEPSSESTAANAQVRPEEAKSDDGDPDNEATAQDTAADPVGNENAATPEPHARPPVQELCSGRRGLTTKSVEQARTMALEGAEVVRDCPTELEAPERAPRPFKLAESATESLREAGYDDLCCYRSAFPHRGRPLLDGNRVVHARTRVTAPARVPQTQALADGWMRDAEQEHASVAAFARAALELMAVGAPPELIAGCHRAALDELGHAAMCLNLARRHGASPAGFEPLPALAPREPDLLRLARDTFVEGCEAETAASLVATRAAAACRDDVVRKALTRIADEEADHAALAFRTLAWLLPRMSAGQRAAFVAWVRARRVPPPCSGATTTTDPHGRPTLAETQRITDEAVHEIVTPIIVRLLA